MGLVDQSLDEIIKERKTAKKIRSKKPSARGMYSDKGMRPNLAFQKKRLQSARQQNRKKIVDARLFIKSKNTITDARQKIKPKQIVDARQKIEAKHNQARPAPQKHVGGIPKVTIPNELALQKPHQLPNITFHVAQGNKTRSTLGHSSNNRNGNTVNQRLGAGIKIAVINELATSSARSSVPPWPTTKKQYEKLKITTVNKDAIRRKSPPPRRSSPPPAPRPATIRKRSLPSPESDDSFEDRPVYSKQRRQHRAPVPPKPAQEEIYHPSPPPMPRQHSKPDTSTLRPMISRQTSGTKLPVQNDDDIPLGPSPIEGTKLKVFNLHPVVTEDDILELFSVLGAVRRARLVKPGEAEVVYIKHENAYTAYKKYNNRDLDGQPMQIKLMTNDPPRQPVMYSWMKEIKSSRKNTEPGEVTELHSGVLQQALFKGGSTGTSTRPVVFTVKI
ncbi:uncharacterized protein LOC120344499 [Styela clava]